MPVPHCPQSAPYEVALEEGKPYFWCTCGLSENQPFCDGRHKGSGLKSHCFTAEASGKASWTSASITPSIFRIVLAICCSKPA